jgi:hypothetical protein
MINFRFGVRCHYCSRFHVPWDLLPIGNSGARICLSCLEWHRQALRMLAGEPPTGCQVCGITFQALLEQSGDGDTKMYLHPKDGIYQILCKWCSDKYVRKRVDLYGDTAYGRSLKLAA